jgi:hypothetical protein
MDMTLTPRVALAAAALAAALASGCSARPSQASCEKAVQNIRKLTGQGSGDVGPDQRAAVRSCTAQSSRDTVDCYVSAQTLEQLTACGGELAGSLPRAGEKPAPGSAPAGGSPGPGAPSGSGSGQ